MLKKKLESVFKRELTDEDLYQAFVFFLAIVFVTPSLVRALFG
jgi:hypothetical protein